jgi:hypothetical protein
MKVRLLIIALCCLAAAGFAQPAKPGNAYTQISQATRAKDADKNVAYTISAIWKNTATPENIFFRADDLWQNCIVEKNNVEISPDKIKKGDKIVFRTMSGGKFAIPELLKKIPTPALFFQVDKKWYYLPVRNIIPGKVKAK